MTGPTLNNSWGTNEGLNNFTSTPLVSGSFSPQPGDLIVVKLAARTASPASWTVTDSASALTWTKQLDFQGGTGNVRIFTALVLSAPGAITVTATPSASCRGVMLTEWWSGGQLAASPATGTGSNSGAPSFTVTTVANGSVVSWCNTDANDITGSRTYLTTSGTPVEEYYFDNDWNTNAFAYQPAATAGVQTCGMSAPTGQFWNAGGIEIQAAPPADYVPATVATGAGAAKAALAGVGGSTLIASGAGAGVTASAGITVNALLASGAAVAQQAGASFTRFVTAGLATAAGTAQQPGVSAITPLNKGSSLASVTSAAGSSAGVSQPQVSQSGVGAPYTSQSSVS